MITESTPWREIGDVPWESWHAAIVRAGGPDELASAEAWANARPHSALALAMLRMESSYGTDFDANPATNRNPWNLKREGGDGYVAARDWADGALEWRQRLTSPTYKRGVYARTVTIDDLINVYAPRSDGNDTQHYIDTIVGLMNGYLNDPVILPGGKDKEPMADVTFGNVPKPAIVEKIVPKPADGNGRGWDLVSPRRIIAVVNHKTWGAFDTPESIWRLFATGGERAYEALTDFVVGKDGRIWMLNDPQGTRAGWASGGGVGLPGGVEGDGVQFVAKYGVEAINQRCASIENCGAFDEPLTGAQFNASTALDAWLQDSIIKTPWTTYPYNERLGIVTDLVHLEFGTTTCPGAAFMRDLDRYQAAVKETLRRYQSMTGATPSPTPPPTGPPDIIPGLDLAIAKRLFGSVKGEDGVVYKFDEAGPVSKLWLARAKAEGVWPELETVWVYDSGARKYFRFADGSLLLAAAGQSPRWLKTA